MAEDEETRQLRRVESVPTYADGWADGFEAGKILAQYGDYAVGRVADHPRAFRRFGRWLGANWSNIMITAAAVAVATVVILSYSGRTISR